MRTCCLKAQDQLFPFRLRPPVAHYWQRCNRAFRSRRSQSCPIDVDAPRAACKSARTRRRGGESARTRRWASRGAGSAC
eukprot:scaffold59691_cov31-Tisochrysis_lutea.AAC.4